MPKSIQKRPGDPRIGEFLGSKSPRLALLGFPFDGGVALNGGRIGAKFAPKSIREYFYRLTPDSRDLKRFTSTVKHCHDRGDLIVGKSIGKSQKILGDTVAKNLKAGLIPIILGGGHETTLGHFLGYVSSGKKVKLINLDAHPDVRDRIGGSPHSGSSFKDALLHPSNCCLGYQALGLQPQSCAATHLSFLSKHKCNWNWASECSKELITKTFRSLKCNALVSIDMDCVDQAFAPGVSAPACGGLNPEILFHFAFEAGRSSQVLSIDIVEVNPKYDRDGQTARMAALAIWHFLRGFSLR